MKKESKTLRAMILLYCHEQHDAPKGELCYSCSELLAYAKARLERCPYADDKPACSNCPKHCYKPVQREQIRKVMRYAGPRMMWSHPLLALDHLLKKFKKQTAVKP
ncbi:MAG: nitrous oxide-stimulated promoter family protein [Smithellaceae bacterium]